MLGCESEWCRRFMRFAVRLGSGIFWRKSLTKCVVEKDSWSQRTKMLPFFKKLCVRSAKSKLRGWTGAELAPTMLRVGHWFFIFHLLSTCFRNQFSSYVNTFRDCLLVHFPFSPSACPIDISIQIQTYN